MMEDNYDNQPAHGIDVNNNNDNNSDFANHIWSDNLFSCFSDSTSCLLAFFVPFYRFAQTVERANLGTFNLYVGIMFTCWVFYSTGGIPSSGFYATLQPALSVIGILVYIAVGAHMRTTLRTKYNLPGDPMNDVLIWCCCSCCAVAQEARHVDRSLGMIEN